MDLAGTNRAALVQSWISVLDTTDGTIPQPGTTGFGGPTVTVPGSRGPSDPGYDPLMDGTATGLQHPFAGAGPDLVIGTPDDIPAEYQFFRSEFATLSWNAMMTAAALSIGSDEPMFFDPTAPFASDACSLARPQLCVNFQGLVPEPTTALLLATGLAGLAVRRRRVG